MKKFAIFSLLTGLLIIIGLSIWLGFPSPYYNRAAISVVGYMVGTLFVFVGIAIGVDAYDNRGK